MHIGVCLHFLRRILLSCEGRREYSAQVLKFRYFNDVLQAKLIRFIHIHLEY
jgi:hypothetical protein